ncbi:hypothetical protein [Jannaschia pohangensis]|uniref:Uncharacterized protein n=1 Tax=Jannaschia pohangensis TaxID=390807 RepID=A0A1I3PY90_9RHOB|nr:hypothetical protein [Jannaschia pohangensis]SFJ26419.1 hypothetical protein SAMN04488095_2344 [Jannaschia pohangensis]
MTHHTRTPGPHDALHADVRRLLDAVEALLDRSERPVAEPIERMLADLSAIRGDLVACASAMTQVADAVRVLAERPDPGVEIARLRRQLETLRGA